MADRFDFLGIDYGRVLWPTAPSSATQTAPAMVIDRVAESTVHLAFAQPQPAVPAPTVERTPGGIVLRNGELALRLPADGRLDPPWSGPIEACSLDRGATWFGRSRLVDADGRGAVTTAIESCGPLAVQWRTVYRWGNDASLVFQARWATGADTIQIVETMTEDTEAVVVWLPFGDLPATAWRRGGGEHAGPMEAMAWQPTPRARRHSGRRVLDHLSHVSYFNQWNQSWVGFAVGDGRLAGAFSGWGSGWQRRGAVRPAIVEDDTQGCYLRLPIKRGRRCWGLVLTHADPEAPERTILNTRKIQLSDLAPAKVRDWLVDPPVPTRALNLLPEPLPEGLRLRAVPELRKVADQSLANARDGGYEAVIIFDGRRAKSIAFDIDVLWASGQLAEADYRDLRRVFLLLAYIFADPDYCTYGDFWPLQEPDEAIAAALKDEIGDCPVPPNFASEYFSTIGLVAEFFPDHPMANDWRRLADELTERFLATYFAPDGTYAESINYHAHAISELLCYFHPLRLHGHRDFYAHPAVKGSFQHFVQLQMPHLASEGCAPLPANGNSGGKGKQQAWRGELPVGADAYRDTDPVLAAQLMHAWETGGRPRGDQEHPVLTEVCLARPVAAVAAPWISSHRQSLGIVSKAIAADGGPIWCLFRAGKATHHMDFDQGNLQLAAWDRLLLGDHGYHTVDTDGSHPHAAATWLHNTLTYAADKQLSSGYHGLERASEPLCVRLGDAFDWCAHRIVNTNYRHLGELSYRDLIPCRRTVHCRHYLFVKPDYLVLWDTFEEATEPATFWLHAPAAFEATGPHRYRTGEPGEPHLDIVLLSPYRIGEVEMRQVGPLHCLGLRSPVVAPFVALLVPQRQPRSLHAEWHPERRSLTITGNGLHDEIQLPLPGTADSLPTVSRSTS